MQATLGHFRAQLGKAALHNDKAAVFGRQRLPRGNRLWIFVETQQPPLRPELAENQPAVPATAESAVQIATVGAQGQCLDSFVEQDGNVVEAAIYGHRIRSRKSSGMAPGC
ncbi:hypothetical protein D3C73_1205990 [compost metagenome]